MSDQILRANSGADNRNAEDCTTASAISARGIVCPVEQGNEDAPVTVEGDFVFSPRSLGAAWQWSEVFQTHYIPIPPDLHVLAMVNGGRQLPDRNGYQFVVSDMLKVALAIGCPIKLDATFSGRTAEIVTTRNHNVVVRIARQGGEDAPHKQAVENKAWWEIVLCRTPPERSPRRNTDDKVRCLETPEGQPAGWAIEKVNGKWSHRGASSVKMILQATGCTKGDAEKIMGGHELQPWQLVSRPFEPEYPGGRVWNKHAPQWAFEPVPCEDWRIACPNWHLILAHIGESLNEALVDGADYLLQWLACIAQDPSCKTPYLFLFGPENSGKSILHEAFDLLVTRGVVKADRALTSQSDFNGELEGAILCAVEEKDVAHCKGAHAKIKDAVTAIKLSIRRMRMDSYMADNTTHWIQTANNEDACLVTGGDTRIQPLYVEKLAEGQDIPKTKLLELLKAEAPQFLYTLLDLKLPPANGRLRLDIVETATRSRLAAKNVHEFIAGVTTLSLPWSGTAKQLCKAVGCQAPADYRPAKALLEKHEKFLKSRRIKVEFLKASSHHSPKISITKMRQR